MHVLRSSAAIKADAADAADALGALLATGAASGTSAASKTAGPRTARRLKDRGPSTRPCCAPSSPLAQGPRSRTGGLGSLLGAALRRRATPSAGPPARSRVRRPPRSPRSPPDAPERAEQ